MARRSLSVLPTQVSELRRRIRHWRKTRTRRSPMPGDLWDAAVALARVHGIHPIAHALGLSYESLKCRTATRANARPRPQALATPFVELRPGPPLLPPPVGTVVEISNTAGDKLAVHLAAGRDLDVVALAAAFVGRRA